jgi:hypothetical protein
VIPEEIKRSQSMSSLWKLHADALVVLTEWQEYRVLDLDAMSKRMIGLGLSGAIGILCFFFIAFAREIPPPSAAVGVCPHR